jgi:hypothetical protein
MQVFIIQANNYLKKNIRAFCHTNYLGYKHPGNPDYINTLKNTFGNTPINLLDGAVFNLETVLASDLPQIKQKLQKLGISLITVCVIPRAKNNNYYSPNQLLFISTIKNFVTKQIGLVDGTNYIIRKINTRTTHLQNSKINISNEGELPYPGITMKTCVISSNVKNKDILLIDDIYTKTVNIDEDCIQALLNYGANSVTFYAIGRTINNKNNI